MNIKRTLLSVILGGGVLAGAAERQARADDNTASRNDQFCLATSAASQTILANGFGTLTWDGFGNLHLVNPGNVESAVVWGLNSSVPLYGTNADGSAVATAHVCFNPAQSRLKIKDPAGNVVWSSSFTTGSDGVALWDTGYSASGGTLTLDHCGLSISAGGTTYWQESDPVCERPKLYNTFSGQCWQANSSLQQLVVDASTNMSLNWQSGSLFMSTPDLPSYTFFAPGSTPPSQICFQSDGNLVVYDAQGHAQWVQSAGTGSDPAGITVDACGVAFSDGEVQTHRMNTPSCKRSTLDQGIGFKATAPTTLVSNDSMRVDWTYQGQLVMYDAAGHNVWSAGPANTGNTLYFQDDGNLVIYGPSGNAVWASNTTTDARWSTPMQMNLAACTLSLIDLKYADACAEWSAGTLPPVTSPETAYYSYVAPIFCPTGAGAWSRWHAGPSTCSVTLPGGGFSYLKDSTAGDSKFGAELWIMGAATGASGLGALQSSVAGNSHLAAGVAEDAPSANPPASYLEALADVGVGVTLFGHNETVLELNGYVENLNGAYSLVELSAMGATVYTRHEAGLGGWAVGHQFFEEEETIWLEFVPVTMRAGATGSVGLNLNVAVDQLTVSASNTVTATLTPFARLDVEASVGVGAEHVSAGVEGSLKLVTLTAPVTQALTMSTRAYTSKIDLGLTALAGSLALYAEAGPFKAKKELASYEGFGFGTNLYTKTGSL